MQAVRDKCRVALIGIPDDEGVRLNLGRPGAARGPHALRAALSRYGVAMPMDETVAYPHVFDVGDVIAGRDIHEKHDRVTETTLAVLEMGLFPIAVGGGHDLTYPFVRAVARCHGAVAGVYFDAHLDVRPEVGSGMAFRRLIDERLATSLICIGVNPLVVSAEHGTYFTSHGGRTVAFAPDAWPVTGAWSRQFVSLDMDVLDAAYAPGVSALNPCGMTPREIERYIAAAGRNAVVQCFDIMELNPDFDVDGRTARVAAHMLLTFLRGFAERTK
jgi:arginase family enzyme